MAEDGEALRRIWESYLPVSFELASQDLHSLKKPEPYFSMVPRLTYFSLVIDKVIVYFSQFIDTTTKSAANLWLDFYGTPLKFNYPIGLLYDIFSTDIELPWCITVNFDRFPGDVLVRCNTRVLMESSFMCALKEADALKHRNMIVNSMQKRDQMQLWNGVVNYKFDQFWMINRKLMNTDSGETCFKHIPFRLYYSKHQNNSGSNTAFAQKLIKPVLEDGEEANLKDLVLATLGEEALEKSRFIQHGVETPLDTPLQWMSEHMSYLDNFLHIYAQSS